VSYTFAQVIFERQFSQIEVYSWKFSFTYAVIGQSETSNVW